MKFKLPHLRYLLSGLMLGLFVAGSTHFVLAWTAPGSTPPNGNVSGPITTSGVDQQKVGSFRVTGAGKNVTAPRFCLPGVAPTGGCINTWPSGGASVWKKNGNNIYYTDGNVGIGTSNPNYPLHITSPNGGFLEFAGDYSGAINPNSGVWPNYVGLVAKKNLSGGTSEAVVGVGGAGGDAPGFSARSYAGGQVDLFAHYNQAVVLQAHNKTSALPILLNTSKLWIGQIPYWQVNNLPTAALHIQADGMTITAGKQQYTGLSGYSGTYEGLVMKSSNSNNKPESLLGFTKTGDVGWSGYTNGKTAFMYIRPNGEYVFESKNNNLIIGTPYKVGIGNSYGNAGYPAEKLHVNGRVKADGFCLSDGCKGKWSDVGGAATTPNLAQVMAEGNVAPNNLNMNQKNIHNIAWMQLYKPGTWAAFSLKNDRGEAYIAVNMHGQLQTSNFINVGGAGSLKSVFPPSGGGIRTQDMWVNASFRTSNLCLGGTNNTNTRCINSWGNIQTTVNAFNSDSRLKKEVVSLENSLEKIDSLRGVSYRWNEEGRGVAGPLLKGERDRYGFIAQEVQKVFPNLVETTESGYLGVDYIGLIAPTIAALQEQESIIEEQQSQIDGLRAEIEAIKAQL